MEIATHYQLEYSEECGFFHLFAGVSSEACGWKNIVQRLSWEQCKEFTGKMFEKYPNINSGRGPFPSFETLKNEFKLFLIN